MTRSPGLKARVWQARAITAWMVRKDLKGKIEESYRRLEVLGDEGPSLTPTGEQFDRELDCEMVSRWYCSWRGLLVNSPLLWGAAALGLERKLCLHFATDMTMREL